MDCIIQWMNANEGFLMVIITAIYVVATVIICISNCKSAKASQKQIMQSQKQQEQNAGLQLYNIRKETLKLFSEKKYNEIYWDILNLFNSSIFDQFSILYLREKQLKRIKDQLSEFETHIKESEEPEEYLKFQQLEYYDSVFHSDATEKELYDFCDKYTFSQFDEAENETITYDYRVLSDKAIKLKQLMDAQHTKIFMEMQEFIKNSLK